MKRYGIRCPAQPSVGLYLYPRDVVISCRLGLTPKALPGNLLKMDFTPTTSYPPFCALTRKVISYWFNSQDVCFDRRSWTLFSKRPTEGSFFCSPASTPSSPEADEAAEPVTEHVIRQGDQYRWVYDVNLWKDTMIPVMLFKIIVLAALAPALVLFAVTAFEGDPEKGLRLFLQVYGITAGVMIALLIMAYPIFIVIKGGRYSILFEMDDHGIRHIEMPRTAKRSDVMSWAGFPAGVLTRNPAAMGSNLLAMSNRQSYSAFQYIRKISHHKRKGVMRLVCRDMTRNLIYTYPADYEFVKKFITDHCKNDVKILNK